MAEIGESEISRTVQFTVDYDLINNSDKSHKEFTLIGESSENLTGKFKDNPATPVDLSNLLLGASNSLGEKIVFKFKSLRK